MRTSSKILWKLLFVVIVLSVPAYAMDHGFDKNDPLVKWFELLPRPDYSGPCCGASDGYPVVRYWRDGPRSRHTWTAVIGDGSARHFPDGTTREPIPDGTEVTVPDNKINPERDDLDNPTDLSWIFMSVSEGRPQNIFCFVRHPQGF